MNLKYFNLNIKHPYYEEEEAQDTSKSQGSASRWLGDMGRAAIFFGPSTVEDIRKQQKPREAYEFLTCGATPKKRRSSLLISIQRGRIWIYKLAGGIRNEEKLRFKNAEGVSRTDVPKAYPIELLPGFPKRDSEVPLILASMRANQAFSRSTFREIDKERYAGNIAAIQAVTQWEPGFKVDPMDCLSSIELETLVAKVFEAKGCFVPAYKGGFLADVDLFLNPRKRVKLPPLMMEPHKCGKSRWSIQVKLSVERISKKSPLWDWLAANPRHLLVSLDHETLLTPHPNQHLGREWLRESALGTRQTRDWLLESLAWLPTRHQKPTLTR